MPSTVPLPLLICADTDELMQRIIKSTYLDSSRCVRLTPQNALQKLLAKPEVHVMVVTPLTTPMQDLLSQILKVVHHDPVYSTP